MCQCHRVHNNIQSIVLSSYAADHADKTLACQILREILLELGVIYSQLWTFEHVDSARNYVSTPLAGLTKSEGTVYASTIDRLITNITRVIFFITDWFKLSKVIPNKTNTMYWNNPASINLSESIYCSIGFINRFLWSKDNITSLLPWRHTHCNSSSDKIRTPQR